MYFDVNFDVNEKINLFKSDIYVKYLTALENSDGNIKYKKDIIIVDNSIIKPPIFKNVFEDINECIIEKKKIMIQYHNIYNKILFSDNPIKFKVQYDEIVLNINKLESRIDKLHLYYATINKNKYNDLIGKYKEAYDNILNEQKVIYSDEKLKSGTVSSMKQVIDKAVTIKLVELYKKNNKYSNDISINKKINYNIDYYIVMLPEFDIDSSSSYISPKKIKEKVIKKSIKNKDKDKEIKKPIKISPKKISPEKANVIKENIKELIANKFKFKNKLECLSQKRSQPYFMSKENIIKEIDNTKEIKAIMPLKYKTLPKEKICDHLFF